MIAVVIATAFSASLLHQKYGRDRFEAHFAATQGAYAQAASAILEAEGLPALAQWLHQLRGPGGLPGRQMLFSDKGEILFGAGVGRRPPRGGLPERERPLRPHDAKDLQALILRSGNNFDSPMPIPRVFFEPIYHSDGSRYWFVSDMRLRKPSAGAPGGLPGRPGGLFNRWMHSLPVLTIIVGVAILVSGLVCFGLARYLTRPIRRLQIATKKLAAGDFEVRVDGGRMVRGDELGELSRDFDNMAEQLAHLNQAQAALLRDVSHELRSPLARLEVALGLAEQQGDGRSQPALDRIGKELSVLDELVSQLLSVARLEASAELVGEIPVDLNELLSAVCRDASFEGSEQNKRVEFIADEDATVVGDQSLLRSAFENIIRNALRHSEEGSIVNVSSELEPTRGFVTIRVHDAGPGVPETMLEALFKPFVRVETARDRNSGGFGVGLAIASSAVRRHRGMVVARNHPQGGLEVTVSLPCI